MNGNGLSAGDVLALSKDNDGIFGGDGFAGVIMLLIVAGMFGGFGGFGWGGNNAGLTESFIDNRFTARDVFNTNTDVLTSANQTQRDILENRYTNELGVQNIIASQKDCCCATNQNIASVKYDNLLNTKDLQYQLNECCCTNRYEGLQHTNDLMTTMNANTQKILDKMCQSEIDALREKVSDLKTEISNRNQSSYMLNTMGRWYSYPSTTGCTGCPNYAQNLI